jgi:hypothetical protein
MALDNQITDREYGKFKESTSTPTQTGVAVVNPDGSDIFNPAAGIDVNVRDGAGSSITSTASALDVNVASGTIIANIEGDYVDDSAFTVASDKGLIVGGVFTTDQIDSGDFGAFKINADRELGVFVGEALPTGTNSIGDIANITNVVSVDDNGGSLTVDGTVTATITRAAQLALNTDTGVGNISVQINLGVSFKILGVKIHFAGIPTANDFVVTSNNLAGGPAYDTVLYRANPGTLGVTDLNFVPAGELIIEAGESLTITFTNAGGTTYGLTTTYELLM